MELKNRFLVCIDSDGCAIDSMTIKHELAFGPAFVEVFEIPEINKQAILDEWNQINLYRMTRGINRFQGFAAILKSYNDLADQDELEQFLLWTETTSALSAQALKTAYEKSGSELMHKALIWSDKVNQIIEELPLAKPFDMVMETMQLIKKHADIAVVSSANPAAITEEWKISGLYDLVDYFYSQVDGTKSQCIRKLLELGYEQKKTMMIGDAMGDLLAASEQGVNFYPILAAHEVESWQSFNQVYFSKFYEEGYDEGIQAALVENMKNNLKK